MKKISFIVLSLFIMLSCKSNKNKTDENPFLSEFSTTNGVPPFDQIENEYYIPAFEKGMDEQAAEINLIVNSTDIPTFNNTIVPLDESGQLLDRVSSVFFAMKGAMSDSTIQVIAEEITPKLTEHNDNIYLNGKLFARIKAVYEDTTVNLTTEQRKVLDKYYKSFVRSGIMLDGSKQDRMREINKELASLTLTFGKNLLAETSNYELVIDSKDNLAGLPNDVILAAAETAKAKGKEGQWIFTLSKTSWEPFLTYADNRDLREKLYKAMYMRGDNDNENDNKAVINKLVNLRLERANMLGYNTYSDFVLDETMAKNSANVFELLTKIWNYALPQAKKEEAELQKLAKAEGKDHKIESWDWSYYAEKLRKAKYALDEEELKPYFKADNVREGVFYVANKLYGLNFTENKEVPVYQEDVQAFDVTDADGSFIGVIYFDNYARPGKRPGAWMGSFRKQSVTDGKFVHPIVYNVGNYNPPTDGKAALLSSDQVQTMFHEFGHGLHGLLSNVTYNSISGTSVPRDFVELPSQVMEHWAFEPEVMQVYAKHYETGKVIPNELIEKMQRAATFNQGFMTTELVAAAILDMKWYTINQKQDYDVRQFEANAMNEIGLISSIIPRYRSTYFSHVFDGGYASGYYSYLWSEVLDSDAFQAFKDNGIFDQATAKSFRENVLSKGGSDDPMTMYVRFRGAEPDPIYLLQNRGFVK